MNQMIPSRVAQGFELPSEEQVDREWRQQIGDEQRERLLRRTSDLPPEPRTYTV